MKIHLILLLSLFLNPVFSQNLTVKGISKAAFTIGENLSFESKILKEERQLNVYLPKNYHADSTYSVIYLLDGSADEDFIHIAGLVQFMTFPWLEMVPESIVVGIANVDRQRDFTYPSKNAEDQKHAPTAGKSANFMNFIEQELQPFVEANYKTNGDKTLLGQSLGGLLAAEVLLKRPDLFSHYAIISPSLWWDDQSLLEVETDFSVLKNAISVFVAVGKEGEVMESTAKALADLIEDEYKIRSQFRYFPELNHANILHKAAYDALQFLFSPQKKK